MGIFSTMRTGVAGMSAQSNRLGAVADNIANSNTTGYKRAGTEFASLVLAGAGGEYTSGSVETKIRYAISEQGAFAFTTSVTDLAIRGDGFFTVASPDGRAYLTRAGSFVIDGEGNLVNAGGFKLLGYSLANGEPTVVANGTAGLEVVNIGGQALQAKASDAGTFFTNLPSDAAIVAAGSLPSDNVAGSEFAGKTSLVVYNSLGGEVTLDVYMTKTAAETWEVAVFERSAAGPGGGFPYTSGPIAQQTLTFDPSNGLLDTASATSIDIPVPNGATLSLDLSQTSQLDANYTVLEAVVNGNAPSEVDRVEIDDDGTLYSVYENGARAATYRIPLANVRSADNLQPLAGNVYAPGFDSGDIQFGFAGEGGFGSIVAGALEQSTVDIGTELTTMIEAQRNYTANSKVFQTGAELLDVLVNLKR